MIPSDAKVIIDYGSAFTKYNLPICDEPLVLLSIVRKSRHAGTMVHDEPFEELVGDEIFQYQLEELVWGYGLATIECDKDNYDTVCFSHLAECAVSKLNYPNSTAETRTLSPTSQQIVYVHSSKSRSHKHISSTIEYMTSRIATEINYPNCLKINKSAAIIVDMGHSSIRLHTVSENKILDSRDLNFGGAALSKFFTKLLSENKQTCKFQVEVSVAHEIALRYVARVAMGTKEYIEEGYSNILESNLLELNKNENSLFSTLPQELITQILNCASYEKAKDSNCTVLEKLGWVRNADVKEKYFNHSIFDFTYTIEHYLAMEGLFKPSIMGIKGMSLPEAITAVANDYSKELGNCVNIVLCGGMVKCPGIVERIQKELLDRYSLQMNVSVDENLVWKSARDTFLQK